MIKILFVLNYFVFIISYLYTVFVNPGIPKKQYYTEYFRDKKMGDAKNWTKCSQCNILIPKTFKVIHCEICQICVIEQDHHCPWTGKCIGKYNLLSFYIFVHSLLIYLIMSFVTLYSYMFYTIGLNNNREKTKK